MGNVVSGGCWLTMAWGILLFGVLLLNEYGLSYTKRCFENVV